MSAIVGSNDWFRQPQPSLKPVRARQASDRFVRSRKARRGLVMWARIGARPATTRVANSKSAHRIASLLRTRLPPPIANPQHRATVPQFLLATTLPTLRPELSKFIAATTSFALRL